MEWKFERLMNPVAGTTEGPVWDGTHLYFTHIPGNRILRYDPADGTMTVAYTNTGHTNGLAFDAQGNLFGCCAGERSIVRFDPHGDKVTIVDRLDGKRLNTPNDLAIDEKGRIWFTNPWNENTAMPGQRQELEHESVLRADPQRDGSYQVTRATFDTTRPNGILVSRDQKTLYVAESGYQAGIARELRAYPIKENASLGPYTTLFTWGEDEKGVHRGIDGMCLDVDGNIVACCGWEISGPGPMIIVLSPIGKVLETHPVPLRRPANCCFGGADMSSLFVTSVQEGHLLRARTHRTGWST